MPNQRWPIAMEGGAADRYHRAQGGGGDTMGWGGGGA